MTDIRLRPVSPEGERPPPRAPPTTPRKCLTIEDLLEGSETLGLRAWLGAIDGCSGGALTSSDMLQQYWEMFSSNFESAEQVIRLFVREPTRDDGPFTWDTQLLEDVGVLKEHWHYFDLWLEIASVKAAERNRGGMAPIPPPPPPREEPDLRERRRDPDSRKIFSWQEFKSQFASEYKPEDIVAYWQDACRLVSETRRDPDDQKVYTLEDFLVQNAHKYSEDDIFKYWDVACLPVDNLQPESSQENPRVDEEPRRVPDFMRSYSERFGINLVVDDDEETLDFRIDPEDSRPIAFDDFKVKYAAQYSDEDLLKYWRTCCKSVLDWKRGR